MGQYSAFAFRAWDPLNPAYEIFYYGSLSPFMKSEDARQWNAHYAAKLAEGSTYHFFADAPAIDTSDIGTVFYAFADMNRLAQKYGGLYTLPGFSLPTLRNLMVIESVPMQTMLASVCTSEGIVFGSLQSEDGQNCHGRFSASVWAAPEQKQDDIDLSPAGALNVTGVIAPQEDFDSVQDILTQAVFSLTFTQEYVDEANAYSKQTGDMAIATNAERQAAFERYCAAWNEAFRN